MMFHSCACVAVVGEIAGELYGPSHEGEAPAIWTYMAYGPFSDFADFNGWLRGIAAAPP